MQNAIALTRASIVFPLLAFLERLGAPVDGLLAKAGVPPWAVTDPEALIPTSSMARLFAEAGRSQGIESIGLLAGQDSAIERVGVYGRLIRRSATLGEALDAVVRHHATVSSNGRTWLVLDGDEVRFCQAFTGKFDRSDFAWQQTSHYILMLMLSIVRLAAGPDWRPSAVQFQTGELPALRDADVLSRGHVTFDQPAMAFTIPRVLCDAPLRQRLSALDAPGPDVTVWQASAPAHDFVRSITQVVEMLSWESYPDVRLTADVLGMSVRTLQRHLGAAGITHESLVGRARFTTAAGLLENTDAKILDIALDLGYSDHAHFTRAFRRWAGCSPQEYRRTRRTDRPQTPNRPAEYTRPPAPPAR